MQVLIDLIVFLCHTRRARGQDKLIQGILLTVWHYVGIEAWFMVVSHNYICFQLSRVSFLLGYLFSVLLVCSKKCFSCSTSTFINTNEKIIYLSCCFRWTHMAGQSGTRENNLTYSHITSKVRKWLHSYVFTVFLWHLVAVMPTTCVSKLFRLSTWIKVDEMWSLIMCPYSRQI